MINGWKTDVLQILEQNGFYGFSDGLIVLCSAVRVVYFCIINRFAMEFLDPIFGNFDFTPFQAHAAWMFIAYVATVVAMAVDFVCGVRKARKARIATTSKGYKMTCAKAAKYFPPMVCLSLVDMLVCSLVPLPVLTLAMASFNIFCEWKSIFESIHEKAEIRKAEKTMGIILDNYDDLGKAIAKAAMDAIKSENEDEKKA